MLGVLRKSKDVKRLFLLVCFLLLFFKHVFWLFGEAVRGV